MRNRLFDFDDSILIQRASTLHGHFNNYVTEFSNFEPEMDATYATNWLALIDDCILRKKSFFVFNFFF